MVSVILVLCLIVGAPVLTEAATYYVATTGSDSNDGTSEATAWLTIPKAVNTMVAGDTTYVAGGTYNQNGIIRFARSGTATQPIKLLALPGERPIIAFQNGLSGGYVVGTDTILIQLASGFFNRIAYITIEGFEIHGGQQGIKAYNCEDCTFRNNWFHDNGHGILQSGGNRVLIDRNIFSHNGQFQACLDGVTICNGDHGVYAHGSSYTITNNLFYDNMGYGVQQNGSSSSTYSSSKHPAPEFGGAANWIIAQNTFAYQRYRPGIVLWGSQCTNARIENNIFYENSVAEGSSSANVINYTSSSSATGITIRNNHSYTSGSGGTTFTAGTAPGDLVSTGNVHNVTSPAFVNGGSNSLPGSPDFRLTNGSPAIGMARTNEFLRNPTLTVGAFDTVATPTSAITANRIRLTFNSITPIQTVSTAGTSIGCSGTNCPGSPAVANVNKVGGTDAQVDITISGIALDACVNTNQDWTSTYASGSGTWTAGDNIGPAPGLHQSIFSHTSLAATNQCTGTGLPSEPGAPYIQYAFAEGTGTTAGNTGSLGTPTGDGTLQNGVTWASGTGVTMTAQSTQHVSIPYGSGINPTTQSLTVAFTVDVPAGNELLSRSYFGSQLGTNQRFHILTGSGTWTMGIGSFSGAASEFAVTAGPTHVCLTFDSSTDTATLNINGVASTTSGGLQTSVASYTLASNFELGRIANIASGGGGTYRHFVLYQSVEDCADIYASTQVGGGTTGTFGQAAVQFEAVYLPELGGNPTILNAPSNRKKVVVGGAVAIVAQIHCENVSDCEETAFQFAYRTNGAGSWLQVPNTPTADGFYLWGVDNNNLLNSGATTTRLTGSCTVTNGVTLLTASQIPSVDLPQDGCVMLRWIVRVDNTATGYAEFRVQREGGTVFTGTEVLARIDVIEKQAGGMGF